MQHSIKLKFALGILFTAIWCCHDAVASEKYGGIGFPSGQNVKNSEIVNLLRGNTLVSESDRYGIITRYFKKDGETTFCVDDGDRCGTVKWSVRRGEFCLKNPRINSGDWWCLVDAQYNDKTGEFAARGTGTGAYYDFKVQRGDRGVVE